MKLLSLPEFWTHMLRPHLPVFMRLRMRAVSRWHRDSDKEDIIPSWATAFFVEHGVNQVTAQLLDFSLTYGFIERAPKITVDDEGAFKLMWAMSDPRDPETLCFFLDEPMALEEHDCFIRHDKKWFYDGEGRDTPKTRIACPCVEYVPPSGDPDRLLKILAFV